jgi:hypothetical protein
MAKAFFLCVYINSYLFSLGGIKTKQKNNYESVAEIKQILFFNMYFLFIYCFLNEFISIENVK